MYLVEIITELEYYSSAATFDSLEAAEAEAAAMRRELSGLRAFVAVRIINLAFATRW